MIVSFKIFDYNIPMPQWQCLTDQKKVFLPVVWTHEIRDLSLVLASSFSKNPENQMDIAKNIRHRNLMPFLSCSGKFLRNSFWEIKRERRFSKSMATLQVRTSLWDLCHDSFSRPWPVFRESRGLENMSVSRSTLHERYTKMTAIEEFSRFPEDIWRNSESGTVRYLARTYKNAWCVTWNLAFRFELLGQLVKAIVLKTIVETSWD